MVVHTYSPNYHRSRRIESKRPAWEGSETVSKWRYKIVIMRKERELYSFLIQELWHLDKSECARERPPQQILTCQRKLAAIGASWRGVWPMGCWYTHRTDVSLTHDDPPTPTFPGDVASCPFPAD